MSMRLVILIAVLIGVAIGAMLVTSADTMKAKCTAVEQALGECKPPQK